MKLQLIEKADFYGLSCDVYQNSNKDIFMTREQIGQALEYIEPAKAIDKIHRRNKDNLNRFCSTVKMVVELKDGRKQERQLVVYSFKGVMEICRFSRQPKANMLFDWIYNLLDKLRTKQLVLITQREFKEWQDSRNISKVKSMLLNDTLIKFADYAKAQGCKKAQFYIINFNKLINKAVDLCNRNNADIVQLTNLVTVIISLDKYINDCMNKNMSYYPIYQGCKNRIETAKNQGLLIIK